MSGRPAWGAALFGFSTKPIIRPSASTSMMPNSSPSSMGTGIAATVRSALFSRWKSSICRTSIR